MRWKLVKNHKNPLSGKVMFKVYQAEAPLFRNQKAVLEVVSSIRIFEHITIINHSPSLRVGKYQTIIYQSPELGTDGPTLQEAKKHAEQMAIDMGIIQVS